MMEIEDFLAPTLEHARAVARAGGAVFAAYVCRPHDTAMRYRYIPFAHYGRRDKYPGSVRYLIRVRPKKSYCEPDLDVL